jgi:hypothetical protein
MPFTNGARIRSRDRNGSGKLLVACGDIDGVQALEKCRAGNYYGLGDNIKRVRRWVHRRCAGDADFGRDVSKSLAHQCARTEDGTDVSPLVPPCVESIRLTCQSCTHGEASASKAYRLSCCVATKTTLCCAPLILRFATHSGCV